MDDKQKELDKVTCVINALDNIANEFSLKNDYCVWYGCEKCPLKVGGLSCTAEGHPASTAVEHLNLAIIALKEFEILVREDINS